MARTIASVVTVSILSNLAIWSPMSIVVITHVMVAHIVALVVCHSCTLVRHRSIVVNLCRCRCRLAHVSIV